MASRWYSILVKENLYGIGSQILAITSGIILAILFPRLLGPKAFGEFSLVFAIANFSLLFCELGIGPALMKLVPASVVRKDAGRYYKILATLKYELTIVSSVLLFALSDYIATVFFKQPNLGLGIKVSSIFLFCYSLYGFYDVLFVAVKRNKFSFYVNTVFQSSRIALPLILYYVHRTYISILLGLGLAALAGLIAELILKRGLNVLKEHSEKSRFDCETFGEYFFYGALGYLGTLLVQWMDSLVVGAFINPTELGYYKVGVMVMGVVWLFIPFSSRVLFALYSEKTEAKEKEKINTVYSYSLRYSLAIAFLIMTGIWLTSDLFTETVYGSAYAPASSILLILSFLAVESALNASNIPLLQGVGKIGVQTKYSILVGVLSVAAGVYASRYGLWEVAFAFMAVRTLSMIILTLYTIRILEINLKPQVYSKPMFCAVATFIALISFKQYATSALGYVIYGIIIVGVYGILAIASKAVSMQELNKIKNAILER